jgi:hypothetical protein
MGDFETRLVMQTCLHCPAKLIRKRSRWVVSRKAVPIFQDKRRVVDIAKEIQANIANYLLSVTLLNLSLAARRLSYAQRSFFRFSKTCLRLSLSRNSRLARRTRRQARPSAGRSTPRNVPALLLPGLKVENGHRSTIMFGCEAKNPSGGSLCLFTNIFAKNVARVSPSQRRSASTTKNGFNAPAATAMKWSSKFSPFSRRHREKADDPNVYVAGSKIRHTALACLRKMSVASIRSSSPRPIQALTLES